MCVCVCGCVYLCVLNFYTEKRTLYTLYAYVNNYKFILCVSQYHPTNISFSIDSTKFQNNIYNYTYTIFFKFILVNTVYYSPMFLKSRYNTYLLNLTVSRNHRDIQRYKHRLISRNTVKLKKI